MKPIRLVCGVAMLSAGLVMADGVSLVVQEDYFTGTDRGYTDGTELLWSWAPVDTNSACLKSAVGVRNRMYTPDSLEAHVLHPGERPYCATLSAFYQLWRHDDNELAKYEIEAGILGPHAYGDQLQSWAHHSLGQSTPEGWDDQLRPDEPIVNLYMERWHPLGGCGDVAGWQGRLDGLYGGALGTTFINALGGFCAKAGWDIPADVAGGAVLANPSGGWFGFVFVEPRGRLVGHNATLGESFFHDRANERKLCPLVGELEAGVTVGKDGFSLTYSDIATTREFRKQNQKQDYGNVRVDYTWAF